MTAPSALHRLWRRLPTGPRRAVLGQATAWLAPRPDRPPPPARLGVAVASNAPDSGMGEAARLTLAGLEALGVPCWAAGPGHPVPPPGVPLILHINAAALPLAMLRLGRTLLQGRRIVGAWPWELTVVPPSWHVGFNFVHEVWAPSRFSADAIAAARPPARAPGEPPIPIRIVPHAVACDTFPTQPADLGLPPGTVVTLVAFNLASSFDRKNPLAAIAAHRIAFGDRPDRVLLLRVGNPAHFPADFAQLQMAAAGLPNVRLDTRTLPRHEALAVLAACDIVLSLHRSEGFGLVPAEAMMLEKPVVATAWSGTQDFLADAWAVPVPARLVPARDARGVFEAPGAVWADPDIDAAAAALRRLADDPAERRRLGQAARRAGLDHFGPAPLAAAVRAMGVPVP